MRNKYGAVFRAGDHDRRFRRSSRRKRGGTTSSSRGAGPGRRSAGDPALHVAADAGRPAPHLVDFRSDAAARGGGAAALSAIFGRPDRGPGRGLRRLRRRLDRTAGDRPQPGVAIRRHLQPAACLRRAGSASSSATGILQPRARADSAGAAGDQSHISAPGGGVQRTPIARHDHRRYAAPLSVSGARQRGAHFATALASGGRASHGPA